MSEDNSSAIKEEAHEQGHKKVHHKKASKPKRVKQESNVVQNSIIAIIVLVAIVVLIFAYTRPSDVDDKGDDTMDEGDIQDESGGSDKGTLEETEELDDGVAALVDDEEITLEQLDAEYGSMPEEYRAAISKQQYLELVMIPQILILKEAQDVGDDEIAELYDFYRTQNNLSEDEVLDILNEQGANMDKLRDAIRIQVHLNRTLRERVIVTDEEVKEVYDSSQGLFVDPNNDTIPFEDIKEDLREYLYNQRLPYEVGFYVDELKEKYNVEIKLEGEAQPVLTSITGDMVSTQEKGMTFQTADNEVCMKDGKPIIRLYSTTRCPHCTWVKETFDNTVKEYGDQIVAYHWELDTKDDTLTPDVEGSIPEEEIKVYQQFNSRGSVPTFVFGCKYFRIGNGYERQQDLDAEKEEFKKIIEELIG